MIMYAALVIKYPVKQYKFCGLLKVVYFAFYLDRVVQELTVRGG